MGKNRQFVSKHVRNEVGSFVEPEGDQQIVSAVLPPLWPNEAPGVRVRHQQSTARTTRMKRDRPNTCSPCTVVPYLRLPQLLLHVRKLLGHLLRQRRHGHLRTGRRKRVV